MGDSEYNPLKGNPSLVQSKAEHYAQIANAITRSVDTLNHVGEIGGMKSEAIDALKSTASDVAQDINKARDRYSVTATALKSYSSKLRTAQDDADAAITLINSRQSDVETATHKASTAKQALEDSKPEDKATNTTASGKAEDAVTDANKALNEAHAAWHRALDDKNDAAKSAIDDIKEVVEGKNNHGLKDSFWDNWGDVIKTICEWAGVLSIFLSWVPILGQILIVLAVIGAVIALVESVIKAMNGGSWVDVAFAAVGVVLAVFGGNIGKYIGKLVKAKGLTVAMKMPRKQFTALTGITRGNKAKELADVQKMINSPKALPNVMKEVFGRNPLKISEKNLGAAFLKFRQNPLGLSGFDNPAFAGEIADQIPTGAKVALGVWNYRGVASKIETMTNNPFDHSDKPVSLKPDTIAKDLAHGRLPNVLGIG
ncbi:putative T7SS-secreted protein [Leifsonia sp. NPDC058292]|uniref:putative T7SS-secreted protein n=1 Tax=Leifsonia sp. NPDC058292 TaxID=3346428 RepID=UPI0036D78125